MWDWIPERDLILYTLPILYRFFQNSVLDQSRQQESQGMHSPTVMQTAIVSYIFTSLTFLFNFLYLAYVFFFFPGLYLDSDGVRNHDYTF